MTTSRTADLTGRVLGGRYRLLDPISSGSATHTFLADDDRLKRRVTVKVLVPGLAADVDFRDRFASDVSIVSSWQHPNIVTLLDWGVDGDAVYVVDDHVPGSLRALLDSGRRLTVAQALMVGLETARALEYAHKRGMIHRGIKPGVLLYDEESHVHVADFGLARAVADSTTSDFVGLAAGSARYVPPEALRNEDVGPPGDVYSLAAVLIESVVGELSVGEESTVGALMEKADRPLEPPADLGPLRRPLERAGRLDPAERPDATEFAVSMLAAAEKLRAPDPLPVVGASLSAAAAAAATAAVASTAPATTEGPPPDASGEPWPTAPPAPPPAPEPVTEPAAPGRPPRRWPAIVLSVLIAAALAGGAAWAYFESQLATNVVPDLIGRQESELNGLIGSYGWRIDRLEGRQDGTEPGEIIAQDPEAGTELREGDTLQITVSLGPTLAPTPTGLEGLTREEAEQRITDAGFVVGEVDEAFDEEAAAGIVLAVAALPPELPRGSSIDFQVSRGPAPRSIPDDLPGQTFEEAQALLESMGLVVEKVDEFSRDVEAGLVIRSEPGGGAEVGRGDTVALVVSAGRPLVDVPDVIGMDAEDAADELDAVGLEVSSVDGPPNAEVTETDPPPGTQLREGDSVRLVTRTEEDPAPPAGDEDGGTSPTTG